MKALLITTAGVLLMILWSWITNEKTAVEEAELIIEHAEVTNDSAMVYLKMLHEKNDTLLDKYFGE